MDLTTATRAVEYADLEALAGTNLGTSSWREIGQQDVDTFAELTGDNQWIHVDPEKARSSAFGGTIAHGYLTLSLSTIFLYELIEVTGAGLILNYGSNRVRYPAPVPVGRRVRASVDVPTVEKVAGGLQVTYRLTYEVEGQEKPPCVAEILFRYYEVGPNSPAAGANSGAR